MTSRKSEKEFDELDLGILTALRTDGRAPWPKIAAEVGSSTSTVRRRYESLQQRGLIRVIGRTEVARLGFGPPAMVKFRGRDAMLPEFLKSLQQNSHVRYLSFTLGTADCLAEIVPRTLPSLQDVLWAIRQDFEVESESYVVTHTYTSGQDWLPDSAERKIDTSTRTSDVELSLDERRVLGALLRDGRASYSSIAAAIQKSENTARRIMESLFEREIASLRVLVEPEMLGFQAKFWAWIDIKPSHLPEAAGLLAANPATKTLFASAGSSNLVGQFVLPRHTEVYAFMVDVLGELPGVRNAETLLESAVYKRVWNLVEDNTYRGVAGPDWLFGSLI
ncbi:Lrp/AsnC family transcriptional regulator [Leucobacter sp. wl10]|uniref:Lrp/AsnC family transcriptional regulator n=1 Tax=Leucobacter sp. wl10 TaxID=2304677 RepID=UPI0013C2D82C|nr:AsnC family transcriptional regulator [Leucobacter sp. wl10]